MRYIYSKHLRDKIRIRRFKFDDPLIIVKDPERKFTEGVKTFVCIKAIKYGNTNCMVAVFYALEGKNAIILTIHPTSTKQITNKVSSGKWVEII